MTLDEIILQTQGKRAGLVNRTSLRYAQTLLLPGEVPAAAVIANLTAGPERFPGAIIVTDRRVLAVCGLPGIKRHVSCGFPWRCQEEPSAICHKFTFSDGKYTFSMTVDPDTGDRFARRLADIRGETDAFDEEEPGGIFNPALLRSRRRIRRAKEQRRAASGTDTAAEKSPDPQEAAQHLACQLEDARAKGLVDHRDPRAVAARLAQSWRTRIPIHKNNKRRDRHDRDRV